MDYGQQISIKNIKVRKGFVKNSVREYLDSLKGSPKFGPQVVHHEEFAEKQALFSELNGPLQDELVNSLSKLGIQKLYSHQVAAINLLRSGNDVIVATPTASGKSLIYNLPVFESVLARPNTKALYLFPLKALAQDQLKAIEKLAAGLPEDKRPIAALCDGDTPAYRRKKLRENPPHILITNPDMLHLSMLGYHESWAQFWSGLTHVVIDEVHTYRGVFGSHMAWVLRRLKRICLLYGADPVFFLSSATIGNPAELAFDLLGKDVSVITESGAPQGGRHFVFFDPHDGAATASCQLLEAALKRGLRTIVYTQSRKMTELISVWTGARLGKLKEKLTSYRAGYRPEERREIESKLTKGELLGVISTSALELGIDIGELDICILVGYPGTIMATWQRGGRVGRRHRESLVIMVGHEDALDQYFMRNPKDFFSREVESAVLNPGNRTIIKKHLLCAAAERFIPVDDPIVAEQSARKVAEEMALIGELLLDAAGKNWFTNRKYPHREVNLRGSGSSFAIRIAESGELLGEIDGIRCYKECHAGAVYLHRGRTFLVKELDLDNREITVVPKIVNYFTRAQGNKETEILEVYGRKQFRNFTAAFGYLRVTETITGYQRRHVKGQHLLSTEVLDLPPLVFETEGLWIEIPLAVGGLLEQKRMHFMGGIHALEHGAIGIFPLLVLCDRNDVGGIAYPFHPQINGPAVFIYDGYPGGVGLTKQAFGEIQKFLEITRETIASCPCETGCPSCVHSPKCGSGNRPIDKGSALAILENLLSASTGSDEKVLKDGNFVKIKEPVEHVLFANKKTMQEPGNAVSKYDSTFHYAVFDVETKRSAAEVGGWHKAEKMGVSVVVLYDSRQDAYRTFFENELDDFIKALKEFDLVVGFNNKRFDNQVLSAYTDVDLYSLPTLDILEEVRNRLGYRLSLNHLAEHTLGVKKSGDGLQALHWYKQGKIDKIVEYCRDDVKITRDLYLFGRENDYILFKNKAGKLVRCPLSFGR
jgi:DEAD/DEAH box helicase domain-containing protein